MKRRSIILFFLLALLLPVQVFAADLTVAVAANAQYVFEELKQIFEKKTGVTIDGVIGSSGKFTAQIKNGAPFDVFISADMNYPQMLQTEGLTHNTPKVYGYGSLVIWTMRDVDLSKGFPVLASNRVKKIAIASVKTAPYGRQAMNAIKFYGLYPQVQSKIVYGESIAQTNQFITTKTVDLGITAKSVVVAPNMKGQGKWIEVDQKAYEPIAQSAVILKYAQQRNIEVAQKFFDFLYSSEAGAVFKKHGYTLP
ncbi:MAG: molybdate ABC transporter substrate-binding protein [Alphaproteobacteria bacterium]|nr:molybdate ABC transporter substrate-binding protein [Alphaproteobacteria bacterium]OJV45556.1 MAG: molybdate ABC transporter substrate-binding protein [Alphaproteobacteria bacterium 43-37]